MWRLLLLPAISLAINAQNPAFETASIKPAAADAQASMIGPRPGGGLTAENLSLRRMIMWGYDVQDYQVTGGPGWVSSDRWTIQAKAPESEALPGPAKYQDMNEAQRDAFMSMARRRLQTLLADEFHLVLRHEMREQNAYHLVVGKGGPKMKQSADQAASMFVRRGRGEIEARNARLAALAQYLAIDLRRTVIDQTALSTHYDFTLRWTPEGAATAVSTDDSAGGPNGPSIFTAIEEQLGLRLESHKAPVETLIIEQVEKPREQ